MLARLGRGSILMTGYRYRSAITGRYVTAEYAKKHPTTTVRERCRT